MRVERLPLDGLLRLTPRRHDDARGFFMESFNQRAFDDAVGHAVTFVQDNHSRSARNVLRGMHYQIAPHAQGKLVRVTRGAAFDVAVDLRRSSPTFGQWHGEELSAENGAQLWIPPGFAHGFLALSDDTDVLYKTTDYYAADCERGIAWNDARLNIAWPLDGAPILSPRDAQARAFAMAEMFP